MRQSNAAAVNTFKHAEKQSDVLSCVLVLPAAPQATRSGSGCNGFPRGRRSPVKPPEPSSWKSPEQRNGLKSLPSGLTLKHNASLPVRIKRLETSGTSAMTSHDEFWIHYHRFCSDSHPVSRLESRPGPDGGPLPQTEPPSSPSTCSRRLFLPPLHPPRCWKLIFTLLCESKSFPGSPEGSSLRGGWPNLRRKEKTSTDRTRMIPVRCLSGDCCPLLTERSRITWIYFFWVFFFLFGELIKYVGPSRIPRGRRRHQRCGLKKEFWFQDFFTDEWGSLKSFISTIRIHFQLTSSDCWVLSRGVLSFLKCFCQFESAELQLSHDFY